MVYHGFRGDSEIDELLKEMPNKSDFIKKAVKAYVPRQIEAPKEAETVKTYRVRL